MCYNMLYLQSDIMAQIGQFEWGIISTINCMGTDTKARINKMTKKNKSNGKCLQ